MDPFQNQDKAIIQSSKSRKSDVTDIIKPFHTRPASELLVKNRQERINS